ncbi:ankyrin repeat domain-containing protein 53 [Menidia menidia]
MATMERVNETGKRRRRRCKKRKASRRAGRQPAPAESPQEPESRQGLPAVHVACLYGELPTLRVLVESGLWGIDSGDSLGRRPLHMVLSPRSSPNASRCLKYLLEHEADVNCTTDGGQTPLHLAASQGLLDCTEVLVEAGADVLAKDAAGHTPLDLARIWCHRKVARYLRSCLWQKEKERETEERRQLQILYRDLLNVAKHNIYKDTLIDEKLAEWANKKGLPPLRDLAPRVQVSRFHTQCLQPDRIRFGPGPVRGPFGPHAASPPSPWAIFIAPPPQDRPTEPDLRGSVRLWRDGRLYCASEWDQEPRPTPPLPLDLVQRVLFPRAFPPRLATPGPPEPWPDPPQARTSSPWTEVAAHLTEEPEPGQVHHDHQAPPTSSPAHIKSHHVDEF